MRVIDTKTLAGREVDAFDGRGFAVARLAPEAHVVCAQLADGGCIGRHDAVVDQLLVVLAGRCSVSGADQITQEIGAGSAALWTAGESHETQAVGPVTAIIVESEGLAGAIG